MTPQALRVRVCVCVAALGFCCRAAGQDAGTPAADPKELDERVAALVKQLDSPYKATRIKAAAELRALGGQARPAARALIVMAGIENTGSDGRIAALEALEKVAPQLYRPVKTVLTDAFLPNALKAIKDLAEMKEDASDAAPLVFLALDCYKAAFKNDLNDGTIDRIQDWISAMVEALRTLGEIVTTEKDLLRLAEWCSHPLNKHRWEKLLDSPRWEAFRSYVKIIERHEELRGKAFPVIKERLQDVEPAIRTAAVNAVFLLDKRSKELLPELRRLKYDKSAAVRQAAERMVALVERTF
jgi:hypothetical protein